MKNKIVSIVVFILLVTTGFTAIAANQPFHKATISYTFSKPKIIEREKYVNIFIENTISSYTPGEPILPCKIKTLTFPLGTKIEKVEVKISGEKILTLNKKIMPAPAPMPAGSGDIGEIKEGEIYNGDELYPSDWISWRAGIGIKGDKNVVFLSICMYPVRYLPAKNEIHYVDEMEVKIFYSSPEKPFLQKDVYDLLIIAPPEFSDALQPLIDHKEEHGIKTILVTTDEIYNGEYFPVNGRDDAEKIKYFIKDAHEQWGVKYVMLAGGLTSPIKSDTWLVPVRYSNLDDGSEHSYLSDLYFADLYKYENGTPMFDDWDSNGNGVFAEWSFKGKDYLDLHPDVYVGRLACRSVKELSTVVEKIINYENECDDSWFKRVVLAGGDTFNDINGHNYLEGEIANQKVAEILGDFETEKIWWSEGNVNQKNMLNAIGKGCGFVHLSGHGSPAVWFVKDFIKNPHGKYIWALDVYHFPLLKNENKLPIVIIGGCHNSMFNTSLYQSMKEVVMTIIIKYILGKPYRTWYWIPAPECMGWWFVKQAGGGAIATFGCTGLGLGTIGDSNDDGIPDCIQFLLTWLELQFFRVYANGTDILGETWGNAINDYVNTFLVENKDPADIKTVQEWVLLGDPSLKIGGYQ